MRRVHEADRRVISYGGSAVRKLGHLVRAAGKFYPVRPFEKNESFIHKPFPHKFTYEVARLKARFGILDNSLHSTCSDGFWVGEPRLKPEKDQRRRWWRWNGGSLSLRFVVILAKTYSDSCPRTIIHASCHIYFTTGILWTVSCGGHSTSVFRNI